jgi:hypothetical protein
MSLWSQVSKDLPMANFVIVQVAERVECLTHDQGRLRLCQVFALCDEEKQLTAFAESEC